MAKRNIPDTLKDDPAFLAQNWNGYQHFTDPTLLPFNVLTFPSYNCTIPSFDKIVPDKGKTLVGQAYVENRGIIGNKQKFKNLGGIEMEVRVWSSADNNLKDVIEVGYLNNRLVFTALVGSFLVGETVSGLTSGASGTIEYVVGTTLFLSSISGEFIIGETITGLTFSGTATTVLVPEFRFQQITELVNPLPRGLHEYYFDEWFDTNLNPAISKKLPRLIWVNGYRDSSNPVKGEVYSWTGGIAVITAFTASTLSINPATTWRSLGFSENANGDAFIVVNGVPYQLTTPADLDTSTIDVGSTVGITLGDTATAQIETDEAPIPFDMCRQNKGYMFYGNWNDRQLYMSNQFNRPSTYTITAFQGGVLNDLVIDDAVNYYTGTTESKYHIVIDPAINVQKFIPGGQGNLNDAYYDTSGYNVTSGVVNTYQVQIIADMMIGISDVADYNIGDSIKGVNSMAQGIVTAIMPLGIAPAGLLGIKMLTQVRFETFENVDNITTNSLGLTIGTADNTNWFQYVKNGNVINVNVGFGSFPANFVPANTPVTLSDGLTITFGSPNNIAFGVVGHEVGDTFELKINQEGGVDKYRWQKDGGAFSSPVTIVPNTFQALSDGIEIKFLNATGHTSGDYWDITAIPQVTRAWDDFYYALPIRRPGEGYKYQLPSGFWTMDTQEESMYVNGSYGEWSVVSTVLSSDLQSETVSLTPLKQAGANKVLYPYLTGHINDDLVYINTEKSLDTLGRKQFLERPQTGYLSDPVKLDFLASSFKGGRIKYFGKRLYISSPEDGIMHVYDTFKTYWQPPKTFPEVGILSIIDNQLICHSNMRNQTFSLFTNNNGDNGQAYEVAMRTPYTSLDDRWGTKYSNMSFIEGNIEGNPKLVHTVYVEVGGCKGTLPHEVDPIVCVIPSNAPFGEGSFGSHPNGSDLVLQGSYFKELYKKYAPVIQWYFLSLGLTCTAKNHTYSILSMGMNAMEGQSGNNQYVNRETLVKNQI